MSDAQAGGPLLEVRNLRKFFPIRRGLLKRVVGQVRAVDDVSFSLDERETLGLVGESGCGKTTTSRCILRALDPTTGHIHFRTRAGERVDLATLDHRELREVRREVQMIFQDPFASLNPRMTLFDIVGDPLLNYGMRSRAQREERVAELLALVGLRPEFIRRFPHAFSGGQRQRIGIARALAPEPRLLVADEPVSALDVSIQAQVLNLLADLRGRIGLSYLFVAHDLSVVKQFCHRVAVMYVGKIVEMATTEQLFAAPRHPYTEALLSAVPRPDPRVRATRIILRGEVANPADPPAGCSFHPRCTYATDVCRAREPALESIAARHEVSVRHAGEHEASCHHARDLDLAGVAATAPASRESSAQ